MEREKLITLVSAAQQGDSQAMSELFNTFYNDVYYFALKTVKDENIACDITQETFVEIINTLQALQEPAAFVKWMKQITYHQCTRHFKKKTDVLVEEDEEGNTVFDSLREERTEFIPDEALDQEDFRQTILAMVDTLTEEQRAAVMLFYYDELSIKEIAQVQGVSENTVKSRLNYARKGLKKSVEDYEKKNGIKLHCAGVLPLLLWLFRSEFSKPAPAIAKAAAYVTTTTGTAIGVSGAVSSVGGAVAAGVGVKLTAGVIAAVIVVAGTVTALTINRGNHDREDVAKETIATEMVSATLPATILTTQTTTAPTTAPTVAPTTAPDDEPATITTEATEATTAPTTAPVTENTTVPTVAPTTEPTTAPTVVRVTTPTTQPPWTRVTTPTTEPTVAPTTAPTTAPTAAPATDSTTAPTIRYYDLSRLTNPNKYMKEVVVQILQIAENLEGSGNHSDAYTASQFAALDVFGYGLTTEELLTPPGGKVNLYTKDVDGTNVLSSAGFDVWLTIENKEDLVALIQRDYGILLEFLGGQSRLDITCHGIKYSSSSSRVEECLAGVADSGHHPYLITAKPITIGRTFNVKMKFNVIYADGAYRYHPEFAILFTDV